MVKFSLLTGGMYIFLMPSSSVIFINIIMNHISAKTRFWGYIFCRRQLV